MSSPLAPVLANFFMVSHHESTWLNEYNLKKPKFSFRYVDGILAAFDKEQNSLNFLSSLNKGHANISLMYSFQVSIIKTSHMKHITN